MGKNTTTRTEKKVMEKFSLFWVFGRSDSAPVYSNIVYYWKRNTAPQRVRKHERTNAVRFSHGCWEVGAPFLKEGFTGDPVVVDHATDCQHRQASVLEFLQFHVVHLVLGLSDGQSHGVESEVSGFAVGVREHGFHGDVSLVGPEFQDTHPEDDLEHGRGTNNRGGHVGVVDVFVSGDGEVLLHRESNGGKHGGASVLDLGFPQPLHVHVFGKVEGIETDITDVSLEVFGSHEEGKGLGHLRVEGGGSGDSGILRGEGSGSAQEGGKNGGGFHGWMCVYRQLFVM
mmetsp:Transcript_1919/g.4587  ORF Transcript_1919/g.4587 Transcript_1919/m.4587 type:complete len:285 (+) Transcript_1919:212-1066(+)